MLPAPTAMLKPWSSSNLSADWPLNQQTVEGLFLKLITLSKTVRSLDDGIGNSVGRNRVCMYHTLVKFQSVMFLTKSKGKSGWANRHSTGL